MDQNSSAAGKKRSNSFYVAGAILFMIVGFVLGILWMGNRYPMLQEPNFKQFTMSYTKILDDYLNGATSEDLINGAAEGMVASLDDPYSQYLSGEKGEAYSQSYEGEFSGIGANMRQEDGQFIITSVIKDAPAERGGILPGDVLVAVDGENVSGKSFQELLSLVRGDEGTNITLKLNRGGESEPLEISLKRGIIPVHTVTSNMLEQGIGHITISRFAKETAEEFEIELAKLQEEGTLKGLVLDMRSNPGGLLDSTLKIANIFVPNDKKILDVTYKNERRTVSYLSNQEKAWTIPTVVLVNGQSASASEVLTAALKESGDAIVVGEKTYGKGVVQAFRSFPDGSVLSLTEAQWKTPSGAWINKVGVEPDHVVLLPEYAYLRPLATGAELKIGSFGEDVKTLQVMLQELGYGQAIAMKEGIFDDATERALKQFQAAEKVEATGQFNDHTGYRLLELLREKLKQEDSQIQKAVEILKSS